MPRPEMDAEGNGVETMGWAKIKRKTSEEMERRIGKSCGSNMDEAGAGTTTLENFGRDLRPVVDRYRLI
jgi:hypothetical protein